MQFLDSRVYVVKNTLFWSSMQKSWTENNNKFFYQQLTVSYYLCEIRCFHLANICIIKIRIFSIKTSVLFLLTNYIAPNWFQSAQGTKKANIYTFYNARSLLMYSKYITYLLHSLTRELDIKELCFVFFPNRKKKSLTCLKKVDYSESNCKGAYLNSKY